MPFPKSAGIRAFSEIQFQACSSHDADAWLWDVAQVVIRMVCKVATLDIHLIVLLGPLHLEVERGVGVVALQFPRRGRSSRRGIILVDEVTAHAVLPAQFPRGGQTAYDAVREVGRELMAQVLQGIV